MTTCERPGGEITHDLRAALDWDESDTESSEESTYMNEDEDEDSKSSSSSSSVVESATKRGGDSCCDTISGAGSVEKK